MRRLFKSVGPAIIVAAVVLGPGSILTSSRVGATFGAIGFPVVVVAAVLMIAMVALAARLGVVYEGSPCDELAVRLGRPVAVFIGLTVFILVAIFQSSNNIALIGGLEPMFSEEPLSFPIRASILIGANLFVIAGLYLLRHLYKAVEKLMKILMGLMTVSFLFNFIVIFTKERGFEPVPPTAELDWIPLFGMVGTTFSVAGAFYQAYLVKEKGWTINEAREGVIDSIISISMLGFVTAIVLLTSWRVFYGNPSQVTLSSVDDVARQLEPSLGSAATVIFCLGILAAGFSSFLVNAMVGGTVLSDSLGVGSKLEDRWPLHLTTVALLVGMGIAIASLHGSKSTVGLITLAQAMTVLGLPALALSLVYLGTRPELQGTRKIPKPMIILAVIGFVVSCLLAYLLAVRVYNTVLPKQETPTTPAVESQKEEEATAPPAVQTPEPAGESKS